ncbi:MAG: hypothetical protein V3S80_04875, partial [Sulfurimonadaceae bacterium]
MIKSIFMILFMICLTLNGQPEIYGQLHDDIKQDVTSAKKVKESTFFKPYTAEITALEECLKKT